MYYLAATTLLCAGQIVLTPSPPPGSPGVRENMRVIKKGGALEKRVIIVFIEGGARQKCSDEDPGATKKKGMSPGVPGGGDGGRTI